MPMWSTAPCCHKYNYFMTSISNRKNIPMNKAILDYTVTNNKAILTYRVSNLILAVHSNASYLYEPKARSRAGGHFFMSTNTTFPPNNVAIHNVAQIIKNVMSSVEEAELVALYINSKIWTQIRHTLAMMGHPQPPMSIQINNLTADGVVTNKIIPKATKAMDMQFHWLHDCKQQHWFHLY